MPQNTVPAEDVGDRDRFIRAAIDSFHETRLSDAKVMRNISVTAYVGSELSQANRRPLTENEKDAVRAAADGKLARRFGGG